MRIGLFGGSFNPPHLGHLIVAETLREQGGLDQVLWMPAFSPPHKTGADLAAPAHRLAMTQRAVAGNPAFVVSDLEVRKEGTSYTVETLQALQDAHPADALFLLIGGDSWRAFDTWHRPEEIMERVPLLVYERQHTNTRVPPHLAGRVRIVEAPLVPISSTDIRERVQAGQSIRYLVPETVRLYIDEHGLYR